MQSSIHGNDFVTPRPETIRRTAEEVIARPDYQLEPSRRHGETVLEFILEILRWIISPLRRLYDALDGMPELLRWVIVVGLAIVVVAILVHIIYSLTTSLRVIRRTQHIHSDAPRRTLDPAILERDAEQAAKRHDFITAVRLLFRACLLRLAKAEKRKFRPGLTNREHLRRYRGTSVFDWMKLFVETIDTRWYGRSICVVEDYEACRNAHGQIQRLQSQDQDENTDQRGAELNDLASIASHGQRRV